MQKDLQQNEMGQLQQDPLRLELDSQARNSSHAINKEKILQLVNNSLDEIEKMIKQVDTNPKLGKYFEIARTNREEISMGLNEIVKNIKIMKDRVFEPTTNLQLYEFIFTFLEEIVKKNEMNKMKSIDKAIWILQLESKISNSMQLIIKSLDLPLDITTREKIYYKDVWDRVHFSILGNDKNVQKDLQFTKKMLIITTSACLNEENQNFAVSKLFSFGLSYPKYFIADKKGQLKSMIFYRKPTVHMASKIWNLPQNGMIMELSKVALKSIEHNIKIYIPTNQDKNTDIFVDDGQSIQVRLLYNQDFYIANQKKKSFLICGAQDDVQSENFIDTVILHMHGGGFLALSSRSMQIYTRRWARDLRVPVFSVDYRMPPSHPFPTAPMDCLKVYKFLLTKIHKYMNIKPRKIIVTGDSAGGNLAFSLTGLIMREKLPLPYGIYSAYPACDLRQLFSPSKLFAFTDPLLNPTMLLLCLKQYLQGKVQNENDPIASPLLLSQQFIGGQKGDKRFPLKWPRTIIHVGAKDPLYDDSIKIMERMTQSKIQCECYVYENISHGFLNLQFAVPDCDQSIKDSITFLKKLIY